MAKKNRICGSCGTKYSYCPTCSGSDRLAPAWKAKFCNETCKDVWSICSRYVMEIITKSEAIEELNKLNLDDISKYTQSIQKDIEKIKSNLAIDNNNDLNTTTDKKDIETDNVKLEIKNEPIKTEIQKNENSATPTFSKITAPYRNVLNQDNKNNISAFRKPVISHEVVDQKNIETEK